ncbi:MAG: class I SAM-dependent methyltransferase [Ramlibacter sp.]
MHTITSSGLDHVNQATWSSWRTVLTYSRLHGWTDPGEEAAIAAVAGRVRGQPLLDIGVGAGRTTELLRPLCGDYVAIDYTPSMVARCRARHPGVDVRHEDARDLGAFADGRFFWAVFSFNGIDSVALPDRGQVLREVHRVLQPGGLFVVSGHNRHGPNHGERPRLHVSFTWNPLKLGWRTLRALHSIGASLRNHRRLRAMNEAHEEWAVANCAAHDFGIVIVYLSLAEQLRQLQAAGFAIEQVFGNLDGQPIAPDADVHDVAWFHVIARKPASAPPAAVAVPADTRPAEPVV